MKKGHIVLLIGLGVAIIATAGIYIYYQSKSFQKNIVKIAKSELEKWFSISERSTKAGKMLLNYWKSVGMNFSLEQMQDIETQSKYPWSSAFISYLFYKAGAKDKFPYSSSHSGYFQVAKKQRNNKDAPLRGFRISEYAPQIGDLVVYSRQEGADYDTTGFFPSHGELVIETGKGFIKAIGGNVSNTVKVTRYTTDYKGMITKKEKDFFMVIQNNIR